MRFFLGIRNFGYGVGLSLGLKVRGRLIHMMGLVMGYNQEFTSGLKLGLFVLM
jgi:hypothetical protein